MPNCSDRRTPKLRPILLVGAFLAFVAGGAQAADIIRGAQMYRVHCASCHGPDGNSSWPGAPNIARREGMMQPDTVLLQRLRTGKGAMPGFQGMLSDQDILNTIAYSRTLMK